MKNTITNRSIGGKKAWQTRLANGGGISPEHRKKIGDGNRGKKVSDEAKKKMSLAKKGMRLSPATEFKKGQIPWIKGRKLTLEQKSKLNLSGLEKGRGRKGVDSSNWKGGITPEYHRIRGSIEFRLWREAVFARDNWTDQKTGIKGGKLHPHHIQNFAQYPELRFAIDNGVTLSEKSHKEFHKIYGFKNNTREQLEEFLNKKI